MDFPLFNDLFQIGASQILALNGNLTVESVNRAGSDINIDVAAAAAIGDECINQLTSVAAGTFLDSAKGTALDRLLYDRYGLLRNPAAPAIGSVQFQVTDANGNAIVNPSSFTIPVGTALATGSNEQFVTTVAEVYPAGAQGPITVAVQSVLAGADQQAAPNTITSLTSTIAGGPTAPRRLAVTNVFATAGAADEETDDAFRARGRSFFSTARRGTLDAIVQGALSYPGVTAAQAFEAITVMGQPARYVQLIISDAYTNSLASLNTVPPTYATQSQVLALNVYNALTDVRAGGIAVQVIVGQVVLQPVMLSLSFTAAANNLPGGIDGVAIAARAAVVGYTNGLAPGITWTPAGALAALQGIPGLQITGNEISSPAGPVIPTALQVIRTSLAIVLATALGTGTVLQATFNPDAVAA